MTFFLLDSHLIVNVNKHWVVSIFNPYHTHESKSVSANYANSAHTSSGHHSLLQHQHVLGNQHNNQVEIHCKHNTVAHILADVISVTTVNDNVKMPV